MSTVAKMFLAFIAGFGATIVLVRWAIGRVTSRCTHCGEPLFEKNAKERA